MTLELIIIITVAGRKARRHEDSEAEAEEGERQHDVDQQHVQVLAAAAQVAVHQERALPHTTQSKDRTAGVHSLTHSHACAIVRALDHAAPSILE